jgi:hypothetical protein
MCESGTVDTATVAKKPADASNGAFGFLRCNHPMEFTIPNRPHDMMSGQLAALMIYGRNWTSTQEETEWVDYGIPILVLGMSSSTRHLLACIFLYKKPRVGSDGEKKNFFLSSEVIIFWCNIHNTPIPTWSPPSNHRSHVVQLHGIQEACPSRPGNAGVGCSFCWYICH